MSTPPSARRVALLSIGSNVEPGRWVPRAVDLLRTRFRGAVASPAYASKAAGPSAGTREFVNLAVRIETDLPLRALKNACRHIEFLCGRVRGYDKYAPRTMDVDPVWLAFGEDVEWVDPDLARASYVFVPCADLMPALKVGSPERSLRARVCDLAQPWMPLPMNVDSVVSTRRQGERV